MITQVDSYVEDGKFETKLKAKWTMRGDDGKQTLNVEKGADETPESGTQTDEYKECAPLTAIKANSEASSPTND